MRAVRRRVERSHSGLCDCLAAQVGSLVELRSLSITELRARCAAAGIDTHSFMDKQDYVDALVPHSAAFAAVDAAALRKTLNDAPRAFALVFLDVDGVLNRTPRSSAYSGSDPTLETACVAQLVRLCRTVRDDGTLVRRIVVSSTWRASRLLMASLWSALADAGIEAPIPIVGTTPHLGFHERAAEILAWLDQLRAGGHGSGPMQAWSGRWVVLDDMDLRSDVRLGGHFVWVDPEFGLTADNTRAAEQILAACEDIVNIDEPHETGA